MRESISSNCWRAEKRVVFDWCCFWSGCKNYSAERAIFFDHVRFLRSSFYSFNCKFFSQSCFSQLSEVSVLGIVFDNLKRILRFWRLFASFFPFCHVKSFSGVLYSSIWKRLGNFVVKFYTFCCLAIWPILVFKCSQTKFPAFI